MQLDDAQKKTVAGWIEQGLKLSEIQGRLASEFGLRPTYLEVRLLVDDLKLMPKDPEPPKPATLPPPPPPVAQPAPGHSPPRHSQAHAGQNGTPSAGLAAPAGGRVSVTVDQIARPGAMASGKVTFSDAQTAEWYVDEMGQLGLAPQQKGYRPSAADVQQFQRALDAEFRKMGF